MKKGHFNYTSADGTWKVRCRDGFDTYDQLEYFAAGPAGAHVKAQCVEIKPHHSRTSVSLDATFVDNGEAGDEAHITLTRPGADPFTDSGPITEGSIEVR